METIRRSATHGRFWSVVVVRNIPVLIHAANPRVRRVAICTVQSDINDKLIIGEYPAFQYPLYSGQANITDAPCTNPPVATFISFPAQLFSPGMVYWPGHQNLYATLLSNTLGQSSVISFMSESA